MTWPGAVTDPIWPWADIICVWKGVLRTSFIIIVFYYDALWEAVKDGAVRWVETQVVVGAAWF